MSRVVFKVSVGFLVGALILLAGALYLSNSYLQEQQRLMAAGDTEGAMASAEAAARLDPFGSEPLQWRATLMQQQGRYEEAEAVLEEAVRRDPHNFDPRIQLANLRLGALNDPEAAAESFRGILETNPRSTVAVGGLAQALVRQGDLEGARQQYERLRELGRIQLLGLYDLGRIYVRTGEPEKGLETLQVARRRAQAGLEGLEEGQRERRETLIQSIDLAMADALVVQGRYDEARQKVVESSSEQAPAILQLLDEDPESYRESVVSSEIY